MRDPNGVYKSYIYPRHCNNMYLTEKKNLLSQDGEHSRVCGIRIRLDWWAKPRKQKSITIKHGYGIQGYWYLCTQLRGLPKIPTGNLLLLALALRKG